MRTPRVNKQTEFHILYSHLVGWTFKRQYVRNESYQIDQKIKKIVSGVFLKTIEVSHKDYRHYSGTIYLKAFLGNNYYLRCSGRGEVCIKHNDVFSKLLITKNTNVDNVLNLIKNENFKITNDNVDAVSKYLRDKKSWAYVMLKSLRS